jgi:hypothetical protein
MASEEQPVPGSASLPGPARTSRDASAVDRDAAANAAARSPGPPVAELIARAGAEVAARQNGAAHEQALLELAGGRMPPLAGTLARAHEMAAAHGGFARLDALASAGTSDTVALDTALTGLKAMGARAAAPAQAAAPAARRGARPAVAPAPSVAPAPAAAPAPVAVAPAPAAAPAPSVAPAPAAAPAAPAPQSDAAPAQQSAIAEAAATADLRAELPAGVPAEIDADLLTGDAALDADLLTGDIGLDTDLPTGDEELDALLRGDEPGFRESQTEITVDPRVLARSSELLAGDPGADAMDGPGGNTRVDVRADAGTAVGPAPEMPPRRDGPLADALPATPARAAGAAASPSPAEALDGWLDDDLGDVEEMSFSIDGSGRTSDPMEGTVEVGDAGPAEAALFTDEPTALQPEKAASGLHEESTAVLPDVRGAVDEPLPPLPIEGDAIPMMTGDERASAMALPPRDAALMSDYDFRQALDDFSDDPPVQIVTRPGSLGAGAGRGFGPADVVTRVPVEPRATASMLDSALEELDLDEALELDDIEIMESESQPVAAAGPPAERLAEGTPPYPPSARQPTYPPAEGYPARQPTPVSGSGLSQSSPRLPLPGLPPPPGHAAPSPPPPYPTQAPYPAQGAPPPGYPAQGAPYPQAPQGHPYPQQPDYPSQQGYPQQAPYPPDPAHAQPPYPQNPSYPHTPNYPVAPADAQPRSDDDDDGKKRGFFGRIFKK